MLHLQEKAHYSLNEFKKGRDSPLTKYNMPSAAMDTGSPVEDDDELSKFGGKTRLVKQEPSSPILDRSPLSLNPVVPLPWSPSMENPQVLAYLRTFGPDPWTGQEHSQGGSATRQNSGSTYGEVSPGFGMAPLPSSPSFHSEPMPFGVQQQQHQQSQQHQLSPPQQQYPSMMQQQRHMSGGMNGQTATSMAASSSSFPQYFPVYDYGMPAGGSSVNGYPPSSPMADSNHTLAHSQRRGSGSPDSNMQAVWQDFVVSNVVPTGYQL
jgi:hypothetical protein